MKVLPSFIPKKLVQKAIKFRYNRLISNHVFIDKDVPTADYLYLGMNKQKLAKIARRNDCRLCFSKDDGLYKNSTKMDVGLPHVEVSANDGTGSPSVIFHTFLSRGSSILPENLAKEKNPLEIIKSSIKTVIQAAKANKNT